MKFLDGKIIIGIIIGVIFCVICVIVWFSMPVVCTTHHCIGERGYYAPSGANAILLLVVGALTLSVAVAIVLIRGGHEP